MNSKNNLKSRNKKKSTPGNFWYDFVKITGGIPALIWMRPKIIYFGKKEKIKGGVMASVNHCTFFDPIMIHCVFWYRRIYSLATTDLYRNKFLTWMFTQMHCIPVDKQNFSLNSFHEVLKQLKRGKLVAIFPEGQVNKNSPDMLAFKSGVILMSHNAKTPIVPVYLVPPEKWYERRKAVVGEPIDIVGLCGAMPTVEDLNRAGDILHSKQEELKEYYLNKFSKKIQASKNNFDDAEYMEVKK